MRAPYLSRLTDEEIVERLRAAAPVRRGCQYAMATPIERGGFCGHDVEPGSDRCPGHARLDCVPVALLVPHDFRTTTCPCCTGRPSMGLPMKERL